MTNKTFCIVPWTHLHSWATGKVYPCCVAKSDHPVGDSKINTLEEIWNGDSMKELRKNIMNDIPSPVCGKCYKQEENGVESMRLRTNEIFKHHRGDVRLTESDGYHPEFKMRLWDVRFSNLCNFKCRTCSPSFSSNWWEDSAELYGPNRIGHPKIVHAGKNKTDMWEQMLPHIPYLEEIYFAGGEPLLMEDHYKILKYLIGIGKTDIRLTYNTNLSQFTFKSTNVLDLWKHFKTVHVGASIDGFGDRAEYIRKGTVWEDIVSNRRLMMAEVPHVTFDVSATVGVLNILHVTDLHREMVNTGLIDHRDFYINVLSDPAYYSCTILPPHLKIIARKKIEDIIKWLSQSGSDCTRIIDGYNGLLTTMESVDNHSLVPKFIEVTETLDKIRGENFREVLPELSLISDFEVAETSMCPLPWTGIEVDTMGFYKPCCQYSEYIPGMSVQAGHTISDAMNSVYMNNVRKIFTDGGKPSGCKKCWDEELIPGRNSKRKVALYHTKLENLDPTPTEVTPVFLDLKLGNICNFKCRICGSGSSSKWTKEAIDQGDKDAATHLKMGAWPRKFPDWWKTIDLSEVRRIEFYGGEPFLINEHFDLLEKIIDGGYASNISIHYNTNGSVWPERGVKLWPSFKEVEISFSIDDTGDRFEYQRSGGNWQNTNDVINKAILSGHTIQICTTFNILNAYYFQETLDWVRTLGISDDVIHFNILHGGPQFSLRNLPKSVKKQFENHMKKIDHPQIHDMIQFMNQPGENLIHETLTHIRNSDMYRNEKFADHHQEVWDMLQQAYSHITPDD